MRTADAEVGRWAVDADGHTTDGSLIVTIRSPDLYLDFWCPDEARLRAASEYLRSPTADDSLKLGSFCGSLAVELDWFPQEPGAVYLSVTRQDEQSMAYCLRTEDRSALAQALKQVSEVLAKGSGNGA
jgi:hypothetical protein